MRHRVPALTVAALLALALAACGKNQDADPVAASGKGAPTVSDETDAPPPAAAASSAASSAASDAGLAVALQAGPRVDFHTSMGDIVVELYPDKAPKTVENFLTYARQGFYNGTIFHRVIDDLLIQGGAYTPDLQKKAARPPIANEANNGLSNQRGTIAAARGRTPASETSEFFINLVDNPRFDYQSDANDYTWGYTVFGKVVSGMDVVDKIRAVKTHPQGKFTSDVPVAPVVITKVDVLAPAAQ